MDIALVVKNSDGRFGLYVLKGSRTKIESLELFKNESFNITSQPMLLDYNGDMISDLLLTEFNETTKLSEYFVYLGGKQFERITFDPMRKDDDEIKVKESNSNAFIDLDGDDISDIFLEGKTLFVSF